MRANREAFRPLADRSADAARRLRARPLDDVLGTPMPAPVMLAPIGVQTIVHADGELAARPGAAALGAADRRQHRGRPHAGGDRRGDGEGPRWFQLYWPNDPELAASFVGRAEAAGYEAIVVTVDTFIPGWKPRDLQQAWLPFLDGIGIANFFPDPVFRAGLDQTAGGGPRARRPATTSASRQPVADLGRPRLAAGPDLAADPAQGHPAPRRRPRGARARRRRHRRLQPRRPPGRRRDRLPRRPAGDRRRGRRRPHGPPRQRDPQRRRRPSRRSRSAPMRCCSAAPTSGAWRSRARPASRRC